MNFYIFETKSRNPRKTEQQQQRRRGKKMEN